MDKQKVPESVETEVKDQDDGETTPEDGSSRAMAWFMAIFMTIFVLIKIFVFNQ